MSDALIHVVDDDEAVRSSLAFMLETAGYEARPYASAEIFLAVAAGFTAGCVITDVRMPGMNGLELVARLKAIGNPLPVIMMTGHGDVPMAVEAMRAGVVEFLEKPFDHSTLLAAVNLAFNQGQRDAAEELERSRFQAMLVSLSPRETEVLRGVLAGETNKVIARDLGISPRTVEVYRANVMGKTRAGTLSELVRIAILAKF